MLRSILVVLIVVIVGVVFFTDDLKLNSKPQQKPIGKIETTKGLVMGKTPEDESFTSLASQSPVIGPLQIVTGFESEAQLQFGESFTILENSSVKLFKQANRYFIEVVRGQIERKQPEANVEFQVDGETKTGLSVAAPTQQELVSVGSNKPQQAGATVTPDDNFQNLLTDTLKLHQRFLEKCFIKLYEKRKGEIRAGVVNTRFQINKKGGIDSAQVLDSDFNDSDFHGCVEEVISRVQFKGYSEPPRTVDFPVLIQVPL